MQPYAPDNNSRPESDSQRFATTVIAARTQRLMSRAALAELSGVSLQVVEDLERGYPVSSEILSAICRNLEIPEPPSDSSPLIRLALLVRERRGRARLSRSKLAERAGVPSSLIRSLEMATLRPSQQLCMALLSVNALRLRESDVAEFLRIPSGDVPEGMPDSVEIPSHTASTQAPPERAANHSRPSESRSVVSSGVGSGHDVGRPAHNKVVGTILVRFYANGRVSLEMRPVPTKLRRDFAKDASCRAPARNSSRSS